jgi:hypothetical protein
MSESMAQSQPATQDQVASATNNKSDSLTLENNVTNDLTSDESVTDQSPVDRPTLDKIWLIATISFSIVLIGSFIAMAISTIQIKQSPEILLASFTTAAGLFSGILHVKHTHKPSSA